MSKARFEQRVYTIDQKTWVWNVRENTDGEAPGRYNSGSAESAEAAKEQATAAIQQWMRMDAWEAAREAAQWEPVGV